MIPSVVPRELSWGLSLQSRQKSPVGREDGNRKALSFRKKLDFLVFSKKKKKKRGKEGKKKEKKRGRAGKNGKIRKVKANTKAHVTEHNIKALPLLENDLTMT